MIQKTKEQLHQEDLERIAKYRPLDDDFMRELFRDDIPLAEMVLRIIIDKQDLETPEGVGCMCKLNEDMRNETAAIAEKSRAVEIAANLLALKVLSNEKIAETNGLTLDEVIELAEKSQKQ